MSPIPQDNLNALREALARAQDFASFGDYPSVLDALDEAVYYIDMIESDGLDADTEDDEDAFPEESEGD